MSFTQFFRILWAYRALILLTALTALLAASVIAALLPPRYEATTRVVMDVIKPDPVTGEMVPSRSLQTYVRTQIELIKDYRIAGKVVDDLGWTSSPVLAQQYAERSANDNRDFRRWLAQQIIDRTNARLVPGSNILEISYTSSSPDAARQVTDAIQKAYIEQTISFKREEALRNTAWFRQQAEKLRVQLTEAEKRKTDFEKENGIILYEDNSDAETEKLRALASAAQAPAIAPVAAAAAPSSTQLAQIDAQISAASRVLGPNHPDLQMMRQQRSAVAAAVAREQAAARVPVGGGPSVAGMMSAQTQKVLAQRGKVDEARRLATDVSIVRDQFTKSIARAAELEQQAQSTETGITPLGDAVAPNRPSAPNVPLIIFAAVACGLGLGVMSALIIELLRRRVRSVEDMRSMLNIPVLGAMPPVPARSRGSVLAWLGIRRLPFQKAAG